MRSLLAAPPTTTDGQPPTAPTAPASGIPRICTFGIGPYCNHYFLKQLATYGRGAFDVAFRPHAIQVGAGGLGLRTQAKETGKAPVVARGTAASWGLNSRAPTLQARVQAMLHCPLALTSLPPMRPQCILFVFRRPRCRPC